MLLAWCNYATRIIYWKNMNLKTLDWINIKTIEKKIRSIWLIVLKIHFKINDQLLFVKKKFHLIWPQTLSFSIMIIKRWIQRFKLLYGITLLYGFDKRRNGFFRMTWKVNSKLILISQLGITVVGKWALINYNHENTIYIWSGCFNRC